MIFVFGSNLSGRHGKGAALYAAKHYGAKPGIGSGPAGQSYAIPTKDMSLNPLPFGDVAEAIVVFLDYARANPALKFLLTPVGCGLAGNKKSDVWAVLKKHGVPTNVYLAPTWVTA